MRKTTVHSAEEQAKYVIKQLNNFEDYLLLLSGGQSPEELYFQMANLSEFNVPDDVAQVDERWGHPPMHEHSNFKLIKDSGLLSRIYREGKEWHPILIGENSLEKTAVLYDSKLSNLFVEYSGRVVGIFGMSMDGHIAGITSGSPAISSEDLIVGYSSNDQYKERLTLTLNAIRNHVTTAIVLLNDSQKIKAFDLYMKEKDVSRYPVLVFKEMEDVEVVMIPGIEKIDQVV